jgi:hypothetical protein
MEKTRGTEIEVNINDNVNITFGSVDKNNPKTIYIKFSAWANTIDFNDDIEYKTIIRRITKEVKRYIYFNVNKDLFKSDMTMVDMDMRESGITNNKSSFMSCEVTLYQINNYLIVGDIINDELTKLSKGICQDIFESDIHFKFFKHKKQAKRELLNA